MFPAAASGCSFHHEIVYGMAIHVCPLSTVLSKVGTWESVTPMAHPTLLDTK